MFLYPLAITLVLLAFLSAVFGSRQSVYLSTTVFTFAAAFGDALNALPKEIQQSDLVQQVLACYHVLPFFGIGMGWIVPAGIGLLLGCIYAGVTRRSAEF